MRGSGSFIRSFLILLALLVGYSAVSLALGPGRALHVFAGVVLCLAPLAANLAFLANAGSRCRRRNTFWTLWAIGCGLWALGELLEVVGRLGTSPPVMPDAADLLFFMSVVPMLAAMAVRPHRRRLANALRYGYFDIALLAAWFAYLYGFFVLAPGGGFGYSRTYDGRYFALVLSANLLILGLLAFYAYNIRNGWRRIYGHLFGAASLHAVAWMLIRWAMPRHFYFPGSLLDLPMLASFAWLGYAGVEAHRLGPAPEEFRGHPMDHRWALRLEVAGMISLPVLGCWAILAPSSEAVRHFRLDLTLAGILVGMLLLLLRQRRVDRYRRALLGDTKLSLDKTNRLQTQLVLTEKLASLGRLAADAAREISDPLAAIFGYTEMLLSEPETSEPVRSAARKIQAQAHRTGALVDNLLRFAQQVTAEKCLLDLNALLSSSVGLQGFHLSDRRVIVQLDLPPTRWKPPAEAV